MLLLISSELWNWNLKLKLGVVSFSSNPSYSESLNSITSGVESKHLDTFDGETISSSFLGRRLQLESSFCEPFSIWHLQKKIYTQNDSETHVDIEMNNKFHQFTIQRWNSYYLTKYLVTSLMTEKREPVKRNQQEEKNRAMFLQRSWLTTQPSFIKSRWVSSVKIFWAPINSIHLTFFLPCFFLLFSDSSNGGRTVHELTHSNVEFLQQKWTLHP